MNKIDTRIFTEPTGQYRPIPFWFWNAEIQEDEIDRQLREMKNNGVIEAFIHARRGLLTPYLSETWFDRVDFTIRKAAEYGMRMWLYDEDNWPSGYAGGRVIQANPDFRAKNLARVVLPAKKGAEIPEGRLTAALAMSAEGEILDITEHAANGSVEWTPPNGSWEINFFMERYGQWQPAYTDDYYVDLINPECIREFIRTTHEEYYRRFKEFFGNALAGIFTDEPGFYCNFWGRDEGTNAWTGSFLSEFLRLKGYDLKPNLISLWENIGEYRKIRADYYDVLSILFRDVFFRQIEDWCVERGIESIGHITIEEDLKYNARMVGEFFRSMECLTIPGVDQIHKTNFDSITPKLGSSTAHVFGRERCMSETFGVYGWKLTLQEMKWVTDWQCVRGVNFMVPHAFYYSIEGERREECPPSEFFQNVWWKHFKHYADYVGRLSYMNTLGRHVADIGVYYPITSVWAEITPSDTSIPEEIDARFKEVSNILLSNQRDFDYLNDDAVKVSEIKDGRIHIKDEDYAVFIVPLVTVMAVDVAEKLAEFCRSGGTLIFCGELPKFSAVNGSDEDLAKILNSLEKDSGKGKFFRIPETQNVLDGLQEIQPDLALNSIQPTVNYLHRRLGDIDIYFLASRAEEDLKFTAEFRCGGVPKYWNPEDGSVSDIHVYANSDGVTKIPMALPGYGSIYVVFSPEAKPVHIIETNLPNITLVSESVVKGHAQLAGSYFAEAAVGDAVTRLQGKIDDELEPISLTEGWSFRLENESESRKIELGSWTDQGFSKYSGSAVYAIEFELDERYLNRPLILDLGTVREAAEVIVNESQAGVRIWKPYLLDIASFVRKGKNSLKIVVTNTLANSFTEQIIPSGLLGPVCLLPLQEIELTILR